jgi:hypothetical protein
VNEGLRPDDQRQFFEKLPADSLGDAGFGLLSRTSGRLLIIGAQQEAHEAEAWPCRDPEARLLRRALQRFAATDNLEGCLPCAWLWPRKILLTLFVKRFENPLSYDRDIRPTEAAGGVLKTLVDEGTNP